MHSCVEHEKSFITSGPDGFIKQTDEDSIHKSYVQFGLSLHHKTLYYMSLVKNAANICTNKFMFFYDYNKRI